MNDSNDSPGMIESSLARLSRLGAASPREEPEVDAALGEALEAALALIGARCGAVVIRGEVGAPGRLVTSGFADVPEWLRSLGDELDRPPPEGVLAVALHHRGGEVGRLVLAETEGGFGAGDADILGPVAAQAAALIALARAEAAAERTGTDLAARWGRRDGASTPLPSPWRTRYVPPRRSGRTRLFQRFPTHLPGRPQVGLPVR